MRPLPSLLTGAQVAQWLQQSEPWVFAAARRGELPSIRVGKRNIRFDPKMIAEYLAGRARGGEQ